MKITVVSTAFPLPARDGLQVQLAGLLRELRARHEITLVSTVRDGDAIEQADEVCSRLVGVPEVTGLPARIGVELRTLRSRRPVLAEQVTSSPLAASAIATVRAERPDVVHLTPGWTAELATALAPTPCVLAALDATAPNLAARLAQRGNALGRFLTRREGGRMERFEAGAYADCAAIVVVTEADAEILRAVRADLPVQVVTNGVDAQHWARPVDREHVDALVVLSGAMSYPPNVQAAVHAATKVMPLVRREVPQARLRLVGRDPVPQVHELAGEHVEVTGTVDDVRPHLWDAAAYLCPMLGGTGVKNKLLEALAAGCPSVVSPLATAGLGLVDGQDVLIGEDPATLAAHLVRLLREPAERARFAAAAAEKARELSWGATAAGFERVYADARDGAAATGDR